VICFEEVIQLFHHSSTCSGELTSCSQDLPIILPLCLSTSIKAFLIEFESQSFSSLINFSFSSFQIILSPILVIHSANKALFCLSFENSSKLTQVELLKSSINFDAQFISCDLGHFVIISCIADICLSIGYHIAPASLSQKAVHNFQDSQIAACLTAHSIFCHKEDIHAKLILFPSVPGIFKGIYFGDSRASFQIEAQKSAIGLIALQVISFACKAAITAIQRITRARIFIIIVEIIHFHISRAVLIQEVDCLLRTHIVLKVTAVALSLQNVKV